MKILVTGAAGGVGGEVVRELLAGGHAVRAFAHRRTKATARLGELEVEIVAGDVRDASALLEALDGVGAVVHLAAASRGRGTVLDDVNHAGTRHLLDAMMAAGVRRIVYAGHLDTALEPPSHLALSKALGQAAIQAADVDWTVIRPSLVFGPGAVFTTLLASLLRAAPLLPVPGDGRARFQPVAQADVAAVVAAVLPDELTYGGIFDLGGPETLALGTMIERTLEAMRARRFAVSIRPAWLHSVASVAERALPWPAVPAGLIDCLGRDHVTDASRTAEILGRQPQAYTSPYLDHVAGTGLTDALRVLGGRGAPVPVIATGPPENPGEEVSFES